jgi:hypothetical protein
MEIDPALFDMPKFLQDMAFDTAASLDMSEFLQDMAIDTAAFPDMSELSQDMNTNPAAFFDMPVFFQDMTIDPAALLASPTMQFQDLDLQDGFQPQQPQAMAVQGNIPQQQQPVLASRCTCAVPHDATTQIEQVSYPTMLGSFTDNTQGSFPAATTAANRADNNTPAPLVSGVNNTGRQAADITSIPNDQFRQMLGRVLHGSNWDYELGVQ